MEKLCGGHGGLKPVSIDSKLSDCKGKCQNVPNYKRQQARKSSIPPVEDNCKETLSLAEMNNTEPRLRVISDAAAVEVPTAFPWITNRMLAESMAETRYILLDEGICNESRDALNRGNEMGLSFCFLLKKATTRFWVNCAYVPHCLA